MSLQPVQMQAKTLYGSGASIAATSIILSDFLDINGAQLNITTDFGGKGFGTIEPNTTKEEAISFTGITYNVNGTATLTGVYHTLFKYPFTESSGITQTHVGGTTFVITNTAAFYDKFSMDKNDETITGLWTFTQLPLIPTTTPTLQTQVASKKYVDDTATFGAPKATTVTYGISVLSVAAASPTAPIVVGDNDTRVPTADEAAALVGTSGSPSTSNKYVTDIDTETGLDAWQTTENATAKFGEADATSKYNLIAQSFTAGKTSIVGVNLYKVANTGTFTGTVTVALYASAAGSPTGSALATVTISNADWLTYPAGDFIATFSASYAATIGSLYWIVASASTADNSNHPNLGANSAGGYAGGSVKFKNTTDGWTAVATIDLYFKVLDSMVRKVVRADDGGKIAARIIDTGTSENQVVALGVDAKLPAVNGSKLTNLVTNKKLYLTTTPITVGATTNETTIFTFSVPANSLSTNNGIDIHLFGQFGASGGYTTVYNLKYGGTTIATITTASEMNHNKRLDAQIFAAGATNSQQGQMTISGFTTTGSNDPNQEWFNAGTATEDSTGALTLTITATKSNNYDVDTIVSNGYAILIS